MFRIGVDVGGKLQTDTASDDVWLTCSTAGTNTDSVLIDIARSRESNRGVLSFHKAPTTLNVSDGIEAAVRSVLEASGVAPDRISCLSIGTTAFINAVLEADARRLARVAVIRLCGPYTRQCPPFIDFPNCLRVLMQGYVAYIDGGLESSLKVSSTWIS